MSLTYQPFADAPEIKELSQDLQMNVADPERTFSALAGASLVAVGLARSGLTRWLLLTGGAALIRRAWSGHCPLYQHLAIDNRHGARGVASNRGTRVEETIDVHRPPEVLYRFWRNLEQLPRVMRHVESVRQLSDKRSHWKVKGPVGQSVEWDAEIVNDEDGKMIAWASLPGASVRNAGSVWFESSYPGVTQLKVAFEYDPPAGALGAAVATLLGASPQRELQEDLARFKEFAERELSS